MRISDWSSDVCSSDLDEAVRQPGRGDDGLDTLSGVRPVHRHVDRARCRSEGFQPRRAITFPVADADRKSTRLTPVTNAHLVCRLLLDKNKKINTPDYTKYNA